jgi:hypothetical protein
VLTAAFRPSLAQDGPVRPALEVPAGPSADQTGRTPVPRQLAVISDDTETPAIVPPLGASGGYRVANPQRPAVATSGAPVTWCFRQIAGALADRRDDRI